MIKRSMLALFVLVALFIVVPRAEAQWNLCQTQLDCVGSYNDLSCFGQCAANACAEASSTDWWYKFEYDQCFRQYDMCLDLTGGDHNWCGTSVLDPCAAPIRDDHRDSCNDIQSRKSACEANCWECQYC